VFDTAADEHDISRFILRDRDITKTKEFPEWGARVLLRMVDPFRQKFERDPVATTSNVKMNSGT